MVNPAAAHAEAPGRQFKRATSFPASFISADAAPSGALGNAFGHDPTTVTALSQCSGAVLDKRLTIRMRKM
jgi:hypothetical protein